MPAAPAAPPLTRAACLEQLRSRTFDLVVIGGGITGAGIARDAALRGLTAALVEKGDFASGTSGNSARIIHGGLRYIEALQFGIVYQACAERRRLHALAPHLVFPLPTTMPLADYDRRRRLQIRLGLWAYDALALYRDIRSSEYLTAQKLALAEPNVSPRRGRDGLRYWERAADDARLTLATVQSACQSGAVAANYAEVVSLLKSHGRVAGVGVRDRLGGALFEVRAAHVVNAAGPWSDALRGLDQAEPAPAVRPNKGIHVAVPHALFPITGQVVFASLDGGRRRMLYALPWHNTSLIGTTDTDYAGDLDTVHALPAEVAWLLESVNQAFAGLRLTAADVVSTFAGLRPLVPGGVASAYRAPREHHLSISESGLISIVGGKLTTHRAMARDVVDVVVARLGRGAACRTHQVPLDPGLRRPADVAALIDGVRSAAAELDDDVLRHLVSTYGSRCWEVLHLAAQDPGLARRLVPGLPYLYAEIPYAAGHEMACSLSDVLVRRTRLMHEAPEQALPLAREVAALLAPALGWTAADEAAQVRAYGRQVALTRRFDPHWKLPEADHDPA